MATRNKNKKGLQTKAERTNSNYSAVIQAPFGKLGIVVQSFLVKIEFLEDDVPLGFAAKQPVISQIVSELNHYFKNPNFQFTIPYYVAGTTFQKRVWNALIHLPTGKTSTYGELAKKLKTGARAIGNACRSNPLPLLIPCHRVLAQHGLGGFSGERTGKKTSIKQWLLAHEAARSS
ncbi:MAG: methylated-DNA--[protein]-cysteine S-methyltransferase [Pseudomonadota bacterium]